MWEIVAEFFIHQVGRAGSFVKASIIMRGHPRAGGLLPVVVAAAFFAATALAANCASQAGVNVSVTIDVHDTPTPFPPYWKRCFGSGHAALTLREDWQDHLKRARDELGLQGVRYHGILDDDMGPVVTAHRTYNFTKVLASWEYQHSLGLVPIVELSFMPAVLANCSWTRKGLNVTVNPGHPPCRDTVCAYNGVTQPPTDMDDWHHLVKALVQVATTRFGAEEVRRWAWEVWNELWGMPFPTPYMDLYNASVLAVKSVDATYRVGGPATSQLNGYLGNTTAFVNESQARNLPFDFVSTHFYPSSGNWTAFRPCSGGDNWDPSCFAQQMAKYKAALPAGAPLYLTEYNAGCCLSYHGHDTSEAAAFAFSSVGRLAGLLDVLSFWTFSDVFEEGGLPTTEFSNIYGAMSFHGVPKPVWKAFALLHTHAGEWRLPTVVSKDPEANVSLVSAFATVTNTTGVLPAVFLSFWLNGGPPSYLLNRSVTVSLTGGGTDAATVPSSATEYRIDANHANPLRAWQEMGAPANPSPTQLQELKSAAEVHGAPVQLTASGAATVLLQPNSAVVLVFH